MKMRGFLKQKRRMSHVKGLVCPNGYKGYFVKNCQKTRDEGI